MRKVKVNRSVSFVLKIIVIFWLADEKGEYVYANLVFISNVTQNKIDFNLITQN